MDEVVGQMSQELQMAMRTAAQIGEQIAHLQAQRAQQREGLVRREEARLRAAMDAERRMAEPVYTRLARDSFWEKATTNEIAHAYGLASRFAPIDPTAAIMRYEAETRARQKWGIDLATADALQIADLPDAAVPAVGGERPDQIKIAIQAAQAEALARAEAAAAQREAEAAAQAEAEVQEVSSAWERAWDEVLAAHPDAPRREQVRMASERAQELEAEAAPAPAWDSRESRAEWAKDKLATGVPPQAVQAAVTADSGHAQPATTATGTQVRMSAPTRTHSATTAARPRSARLSQ